MPDGSADNVLVAIESTTGTPTVQIVSVDVSRVVVQLLITPALHQPHGIVHGGVYAAAAEFAARLGAQAVLDGSNDGTTRRARTTAIGTQFLRAIRDGTVTVEATPVHRGRSQQLWQVRMATTNELGSADQVVAIADVRLRNDSD